MNSPEKKQVYFPNLDGLRLIGSLIIIILHIEELKVISGRPHLQWIEDYLPLGNIDVSLFFVLSGFLIGYLLLKEKHDTGNIMVKKYYTRRALRIWPLYYLIMPVGFFLFPYLADVWNIPNLGIHSSYKNVNFILCLLFLPPYGVTLRAIGAAWSVRVEEFFYVLEPFLLKKTRKYVRTFIGVILVTLIIRNGYGLVCTFCNLPDTFRHFEKIIACYRLSCMAIGGIGAYLVVAEKKEILQIIYRKDLQWIIYLLTLLLLMFNIRIRFINFEFYSILFCYIIINLATNKNSILKLDFKWTNYLGKTSYGLYMYGTFMRIFCLAFTERLYGHNLSGWKMNLVFYLTTIVSTVIISILSYEFFEKPFLRIKNRFEIIKTGTKEDIPADF